MEEFEDVKRGGKRDKLHREIDSFGNDLPEDFFGDVGSGEGTHEAEADFGEGQLAKLVELLWGMAGDFRGHVETTIGGQATKDGAAEGGEGGFAGSAAVAHEQF